MQRPGADYKIWLVRKKWYKRLPLRTQFPYTVEFDGIKIDVPDRLGELIIPLLANPGRPFGRADFADYPDNPSVYIHWARRHFRNHDVLIDIQSRRCVGYVFRGFSRISGSKDQGNVTP